MICSDWVHINHHEKDNLPGMRPSGQASLDEIHIRGADTKCERSEPKMGVWGLAPGKIFATTPFRSLENAHFCKEVDSNEKGRENLPNGMLFWEIFKIELKSYLELDRFLLQLNEI